MYDLSKNFYKRNELSIKKDESVLTGEGPGSLSSCIRSKGYRFMKDVCCPECALSYLHEYIGDVEKYVIYTEKDANFANKNLVNPLPLIWKGDAGEISMDLIVTGVEMKKNAFLFSLNIGIIQLWILKSKYKTEN